MGAPRHGPCAGKAKSTAAPVSRLRDRFQPIERFEDALENCVVADVAGGLRSLACHDKLDSSLRGHRWRTWPSSGELERVFEPFYRLDIVRATEHTGGSGLGLCQRKGRGARPMAEK